MNPENWHGGEFCSDRRPLPSQVPIYEGGKLYITRNVRKDDDFVNGMQCTVQKYYPQENTLRVITKTSHRLVITPWCDLEKGGAVYFPVWLGYASTIHKVQGDEFAHSTIWLDVPNMPAAGYTVLSRVQTSNAYLLGGRLKRKNFVPATH